MIDNTLSSNGKSLENSRNQYNSYNAQKNTQNILHEDPELERYMAIVGTELKALGYTLDNRAFISNIITILDKLIEPNKFNKTIFFHILDFANLNPDSFILLLDFFKSFFNVYQSMKKNKSEKVLEINKCQEELNVFRSKMIPLQKEEKILENGLTNNSNLKISAVNITIDYLAGQNSAVENLIKLKFRYGNLEQEIDSSTLNRKVSFNINSLSQLEESLRIFLLIGEKEIFVERINPRDILDNPIQNKYKYENIQFELNLIWINSKINYYNKQIAELESKISEDKEIVEVFNNSLRHIEDTFKNYFSEVRQKEKDSIIRIPTQDQGTMNKELELSQKIEDNLLRMIGKEVVTWDKIVHLSNKIILLLMLLILFKRGDFLTLFVDISLLCVEFRFIKKSHCYTILMGLIISIFLDFFWILYYFRLFTTHIPLDGSSGGIGSRQFCLVISSIVFLLKMIFAFSLWRLALEYRLYSINKNAVSEQIVSYYSDPIPQMKIATESESNNKVQRISRPILKYFIPKQHRSFILRNLEEEQ